MYTPYVIDITNYVIIAAKFARNSTCFQFKGCRQCTFRHGNAGGRGVLRMVIVGSREVGYNGTKPTLILNWSRHESILTIYIDND